MPADCYEKRSRSSFGNIIRNGVLASMVRQDYEYFDKTPAGILQVSARGTLGLNPAQTPCEHSELVQSPIICIYRVCD